MVSSTAESVSDVVEGTWIEPWMEYSIGWVGRMVHSKGNGNVY